MPPGEHGQYERGQSHPRWRGGRYQDGQGYVLLLRPEHPRANGRNGYVLEHVLVAEKALDRHLIPPECIHHANGDPSDNSPENLVVCQDQAFHMLLHRRMRAKADCGHAEWRKCNYCCQYDDATNMKRRVRSGGTYSFHHRKCHIEWQRKRRALKRSAATGDGGRLTKEEDVL